MYHEKIKHIDYKMHFVRQKVEEGSVDDMKIHTSINPTDILTKPVDTEMFKVL